MMPPPLSPDEPLRLKALRELNIVDTPLEERFELITRMARRLLRVPISAISLLEADRQWFKSIQGLNCSQTSRDISFCGHAILEPDVFIVRDARQDERFADNPLVTEKNMLFYAGAPIHSIDGAKIGMLCVNDHEPRDFGEDEVQTLRDLAKMAEAEIRSSSASAVQAALIEDCSVEQRMARIDPLTRLWNRAGIDEVAVEALSFAAGDRGGVTIAIVDLDGFKAVNDTHGHDAGDEALRVCAKRLLSAVRETDAVGRRGGDEFAIVISPCNSEREGVAVAEQVCSRLAGMGVEHDGARLELGASVGVRHVSAGCAEDLERVLREADTALYDAKRAGRGRVAVWSGESTDQAAA